MNLSIIVPLDGSELAESALPWAGVLAARKAARIVLVSVLEMPTEFAAWVTVNQLSETPEMTDVIDERRAYLKRMAAAHGLDDAEVELRIGAPGREILACAAQFTGPRPLIVMSTHGHGGLKRLAFGSVAQQVIQNYDGPVMTVRDSSATVTPSLQRLLIPVDGSDFSARAVEQALELLGEPYPAVHLLRVVATPSWAARTVEHGLVAQYLEASREWAQEQLDELAEKTATKGHSVSSEVRPYGNVVDEILGVAEASGVDAIAMSTHGLGGVGRIVLGSIADGVLRRSPRPVILLRPPSTD